MSRSSSKFPSSSQEYIPSTPSTIPGSTLPKNTHIYGNLVLIFELSNREPCKIRLRVSSKYAQDTLINDYVAPSPSRKVKWLYHITLSPPQDVKSGWSNVKEAMEEEHAQIKGVLGHKIKLVADSMRITNVEGRDVNIEATGARMVSTETKGAWTIFQATTQSTAPSWLESPPSSSNIDAPSRHIARPPQPPLPTNLRPITSHIPVKVGIRPMEAAFVAAAQKRKRSESPSKSLAEASTSAVHVDKRFLASLGSSVRPSGNGFPSRFPTRVGREPTATQTPLSSVEPEPATVNPIPSRDIPDVPPKGDGSTSSAAVVYRLNPITQNAYQHDQPTFMSRPNPVPPIEVTRAASPPRSTSPSKPASNARAEAEAKARSAAARRHALELVAEEEESAKANELSSGLVLPAIRYTTIKETRSDTVCNVMGIVLETHPPKQSSTAPDWMVEIIITDPTIYTGDSSGEDKLIALFRRDISSLPGSIPRGTPILFRKLKFSTYKGKVKGQAYSRISDRNCWVYLLGETQMVYSDLAIVNPKLSEQEIARLKALKKWWADSEDVITGPRQVDAGASVAMSRAISSGSGRGGKAKLRNLGDLQYGDFCDVIVKIVHIGAGSGAYCELYVVDGTVSRLPLRNYHNVEHPHVPISGVFKIDIMAQPSPIDQAKLTIGNVVMLQNVQAKEYRNAMELKWVEKVTDEQAAKGWKNREPILIRPGDERALAIEARINEHRAGGRTGSADSSALKQESPPKPVIAQNTEYSSLSPEKPRLSADAISSASAHARESKHASVQQPRAPIRLATHVFTTHTDPIEHQTQTISEILANATFPNKFRVKARVMSVHSREIKGNDTYVQKHCGHCKRAIVKKHYCESCNDIKLSKASWRYHFIAILEDEDSSLPIMISDEEAARFLPALPPCSASDNPNDIRKTYRQIAETSKGVLDVLQGAPLDGIRPLPYIDWTVMSYIVPAPKGYGGVGGCRGVAVYKAFGMEGK